MNKSLQIVLFICLLITILCFFQFFQESLVYSRKDIENGELWRLWTGQFVHINYQHLLLNSIGLLLFIIIYKKNLLIKILIIELCMLSSGIAIGLYYLSTTIFLYAGLSGVLYGLFTLYSTKAIKLRDYLLGYFVFFIISFKIIWSYIELININNLTLIQAPIANDAHLYGYITAIIITSIKKLLNDRKII